VVSSRTSVLNTSAPTVSKATIVAKAIYSKLRFDAAAAYSGQSDKPNSRVRHARIEGYDKE
jgi:hypothetical protein